MLETNKTKKINKVTRTERRVRRELKNLLVVGWRRRSWGGSKKLWVAYLQQSLLAKEHVTTLRF